MKEVLSNTVPMMLSEDYKERFKAEYQQLVVRCSGLNDMLINWNEGKLDFTPKCKKEIFENQFVAMSQYLKILRERAQIESIKLY